MQALRQCCLLSTLALTLTACASRAVKETPLPAGAASAAHGIECHSERATGSLIPATVCTTAEERARRAAGAQETKDWLNNVKAGACAPTGPCK